MNGAESLVSSLATGGIEVCFTNPGTSEMHLVAALDRMEKPRCVLSLFEGVVTGAADGYARMAGKPACTLLHLGPGLANGLANLHNASRAQTPLVNLVGQHPSYHLRYDTPLKSDIESIARPYSQWLRTARAASAIGRDAAEAIAAARTAPGQIATLIVPADVAWSDGGAIAQAPVLPGAPMPPAESIERAARMLRSAPRTALLIAGSALYGKGLAAAGRIASAAGAKLLSPYPFARMERGTGRPRVERTPYVLEQAVDKLKEFRQLILVGTTLPVSYFAYPGKNSVLTSPDCELHTLASPGEDYAGALDALASTLDAPNSTGESVKMGSSALPSGPLSLSGLAAVVGALLPENTIVVDESMTSGRGMMAATQGAPPHDWLANTGGSIGIALPLAVGAAVACPERPVLCLTADGSAMYTAQALWTMARYGLKVVNVVFANHAYNVLKWEFSGLGVGDPGRCVSDLFDIGHPDIDWVRMASGMGIHGRRADSLDAFALALKEGFESGGPSLIEINLRGVAG